MISLKQDTMDIGGLVSILNRYGDTEVKLNLELLNADYEKYSALSVDKTKSKVDRKNFGAIAKYLLKIKNKADVNGVYQMTWMYEHYKVKAYPVSLGYSPAFRFTAVDYIEPHGGKLVSVSYADVFKIIAFDMMYRDYDCKLSDIENDLKSCSIMAPNPAHIIMDVIKKYTHDEDIVTMASAMRIGNSPYATPDCAMAWDYFGTAHRNGEKAFECKYYHDAVYRSLDVANAIIVSNILSKFISYNISFKICGVDTENMYFIVGNDAVTDNNKASIFEPVTVRTFGRLFEVKPVINFF